jgi:hypothetical protein
MQIAPVFDSFSLMNTGKGAPLILQPAAGHGTPDCLDEFDDKLSTRARLPVLVRDSLHIITSPHLGSSTFSCASNCGCAFLLISDVEPYTGFPYTVPNAVSNSAIANLQDYFGDLCPEDHFTKSQLHSVNGPRNLFPNLITAVLEMLQNLLQRKWAVTAASPRRKEAFQRVR